MSDIHVKLAKTEEHKLTLPIEYDYFPLELRDNEKRFFCALLENVLVETSNEKIDTLYKKGIYSFLSKKQRNIFTMVCNDAKDSRIAIRYNLKPNKDTSQ
jgi:hypothetical protein